MLKQIIHAVKRNFEGYRVERSIRRKRYLRYEELNLDKADVVLLDKPLASGYRVGIVDEVPERFPRGYYTPRHYTPKYIRFLEKNNIDYEVFDINRSDWVQRVAEFDLIVWHTSSEYNYRVMAVDKIYFIERKLGKRCYPSLDEMWGYENKVNSHYLYRLYDLPEIPTFSTSSEREALEYLESTSYPIISKTKTASRSSGVRLLKNKVAAKKFVDDVFSYRGAGCELDYVRQKDYVLFQKFMAGASFDLRIVVIGDALLGYYRYPKSGDFRASGAGIYEKKSIPIEALDLAYKVKAAYEVTNLAIDLLYDEGQYYIIETSFFIGVDTCEQLIVDGKSGYYRRVAEGQYEFKEGRFWIQELSLKELFDKQISR